MLFAKDCDVHDSWNVCTRPCGFCAVSRGRPEALEDDEPTRVAEAAFRLGLKHVVITSVTRDDLPDGRSRAFYQNRFGRTSSEPVLQSKC